jgi:hypothetical protein
MAGILEDPFFCHDAGLDYIATYLVIIIIWTAMFMNVVFAPENYWHTRHDFVAGGFIDSIVHLFILNFGIIL